jgi:hypothetical protein
MTFEVRFVPNAMVSESALPDFFIPAELVTNLVGVASFDELHCPFQRDSCRGKQQMESDQASERTHAAGIGIVGDSDRAPSGTSERVLRIGTGGGVAMCWRLQNRSLEVRSVFRAS